MIFRCGRVGKPDKHHSVDVRVLLAGDVEIFHSSEIRGGETVRAANPMQTNAFFGVKRGFPGEGVDTGFPLQLERFMGG